ncbi:MAG: hypothetical protein WKG00_00615 [Polyangiaceae bacterium]
MKHILALPLLASAALAGCGHYDAPPSATLVGLQEGLLPDSAAPLLLQFSEPVDKATARVKVGAFITDGEGNLGDEDDDTGTTFTPDFVRQPGLEDQGGTSAWVDDRTLRIEIDSLPPVGQSRVVVIEKDVADLEGNVADVRQRILFGYEFACKGKQGSKIFPDATYFFLVDVETPIEAQIQMYAVVRSDPNDGRFLAQFTNADRNRDPNRCPTPCAGTEACQTIPAVQCVAPSTKMGLVDEYPDWIPNVVPPVGFTFTVGGCVEDQEDGSAAFANQPTDVKIESPPVTVKGTRLAASFTVDAEGVVRGIGTMQGDDVLLFESPSGPGVGSLTARILPEADVPPDLPQPPQLEPAETPDGGL